MTRELNIICQACDKPLGDTGDKLGNLWIGHADVTAYVDARQAWDAKNTTHNPDGSTTTVTGYMELASWPDRPKWRAHHLACDDGEVSELYAIPSNELRTWANLVSWTAQLSAKTWIGNTNWFQLTRAVAAGESTLIVRAESV